MDKKYQVFISSTYKDLVDERDVVIKAILELLHIPIGMEMFSAEDEEQWNIIKRTIDHSDYYVLILGLRYGHVTSDGISFTQKEYEYALEKKIPIMAFLMDENVSIERNRRDDDLTKINEFRSKVLTNSKMAKFWMTKDDLVSSVSISFTKQISLKPGIGWVRGDAAIVNQSALEEMSALNKENRELRERVEYLEKTINVDAPKLNVKVKNEEILFNYKYTKEVRPSPIIYDDICDELKPYTSLNEVSIYNKSIPDEKEMDRFNKEMELFERKEFNSFPIEIDISNIGLSKANSIHIDIIFPNHLLISKADSIESMPNNPIPENILEKAKEKQRKRNRDVFGIGSLANISNALDLRPNPYDYSPVSISKLNSHISSRIDGNILRIMIVDLLHTRGITLSEYKVTPLNHGPYELEIDMFCEQYKEVETVKILI